MGWHQYTLQDLSIGGQIPHIPHQLQSRTYSSAVISAAAAPRIPPARLGATACTPSGAHVLCAARTSSVAYAQACMHTHCRTRAHMPAAFANTFPHDTTVCQATPTNTDPKGISLFRVKTVNGPWAGSKLSTCATSASAALPAAWPRIHTGSRPQHSSSRARSTSA